MARAYSLDLRERVVGAVAAGQSCRAVAVTFKVSVASVVKWSQRFRATGSAAAHKVGGRRPYALGRRAGLAAGAALREARHYASGAGGGTGRARDQSELLRSLAFFRARRDQLQKKACTPASRIAPTSPGDERSGRSTKGGLIPPVSSSSTRLGPRPT